MGRMERYLAANAGPVADALRAELERSRDLRQRCIREALEHAEAVGDTEHIGFLRAGLRSFETAK